MTPGEPDDRTLAAHALAGHQDAYAALMRRHRDAVWRLARGHVGDNDEALDITQEVFIAAFAALARYDGARPFRAWIARITLNKCRDWGRRRAVRRFFAFARPIDEAGDIADVAPDPEAALQSQRELARINAAIAALPAPLKDVLLALARNQSLQGWANMGLAGVLTTGVQLLPVRTVQADVNGFAFAVVPTAALLSAGQSLRVEATEIA